MCSKHVVPILFKFLGSFISSVWLILLNALYPKVSMLSGKIISLISAVSKVPSLISFMLSGILIRRSSLLENAYSPISFSPSGSTISSAKAS